MKPVLKHQLNKIETSMGGVQLKITNYFWFMLDGMMWVNLPSGNLLTNSNLRAQAVLKIFLQIGNKD